MKHILLLVLMFMVFITPCTFAADGKVYENQEYKFHVTLPDDWQLSEHKVAMVEAHAPGKFPSVMFFCDPVSKHKTNVDGQESEVSWYITSMKKSHPDIVLMEKNNVIISNNNAIRVVLSNNNVSSTTYFVYTNNYVFCIIATGLVSTLDKDQSTYNQIISTVKILD